MAVEGDQPTAPERYDEMLGARSIHQLPSDGRQTFFKIMQRGADFAFRWANQIDILEAQQIAVRAADIRRDDLDLPSQLRQHHRERCFGDHAVSEITKDECIRLLAQFQKNLPGSLGRPRIQRPALRLFDFEQLGVFHQIAPLDGQGASIQQRVDFDVVGSELRLCISGEAVLAQGGDQLHRRTEAGQVPGDDAGASEISVLLQLLQ